METARGRREREPLTRVEQRVATSRRQRERLTPFERRAAAVVALCVLAIALWIILDPPDRRVALSGCESASAGCLVTVDGDVATVAAALVALAAVGGLVALIGVRFTTVKAAGIEISRPEAGTAGLPSVPNQTPTVDDAVVGDTADDDAAVGEVPQPAATADVLRASAHR